MGSYGAFLIAALIAASGVIAYIGDVIGRRLGRRRLTLFHLRPRHTAVAISVLAGMLIAAFTLLSAMLVSQNVRDAFLRVAEMRREIQHLEAVARELEHRVQRARTQAAQARQQLGAAKLRLRAVLAALESQGARLERQRRELTATRERLAGVSRQLRDKVAQLAVRQKGLDEATARLRQVSQQLTDQRRELLTQREELSQTRAALAEAQHKLEAETARLTQVERDLAEANHQLDNATRVVRDTARTLFSLESQRDQLQAQIQDLAQWRSQALQTFGVMRTQPVIFGANEEILTAVIKGARPAPEVRRDLEAFVAAVNRAALSAGAGAEQGPAIAVLRPVLDEATGQVVFYGEEQVLDALAAAISSAEGSVIVRAASVGNRVRGETVLVDFELFHNELVFRRGEELAQTEVDSSLNQAALVRELVNFLRDKVARRARAAGVMPRAAARLEQGKEGLFPPLEEAVGEISYPDLLKVVEEIRARRGLVRVSARAAADTWTAGPLRVRLVVVGRA